MSDNPYESPTSDPIEPAAPSGFQLTEPRSTGFTQGWQWIADGFGYFKKNPGPWIGAIVVWLLIAIGLSLIPLIGSIAFSITTYVWVAGFMLGCREQDKGNPFKFDYLFAGFSNNAGKLILLSVISVLVSIVVFVGAFGTAYIAAITNPDAATDFTKDLAGIWLSFLVAMLILLPLMMALFFAPALIVLNDKPVLEAMKLSFIACLRNILPFLLYGFAALIIYIIGMIPLGLGLLVVIPTLIASVYTSYKAIFIQ